MPGNEVVKERGRNVDVNINPTDTVTEDQLPILSKIYLGYRIKKNTDFT